MPKTPPPRKRPNSERRGREFLTEDEVERLIRAAKKHCCRHPERDSALILLMYRHGLRVSEAVALTWDQIDLEQGVLHVRRVKRGSPSTHPLTAKELTALRKVQTNYPGYRHVFISDRKAPLSPTGVRQMLALVSREAGLDFPVHPHMLRHATGYQLANDGVDTRRIQHYLGHKNIQHTMRYTELAEEPFKGLFKD